MKGHRFFALFRAPKARRKFREIACRTPWTASPKGPGGWVERFEKCRLKGVVRGTGADRSGELEGSRAAAEAFALGRSF